jgi:hypothetical protein
MAKVTFHRNGKVSVDGVVVGEVHQPDPSGAPHARTLYWQFRSNDGHTDLARTRGSLDHYAVSAASRIARSAA